MSKEDLRRYLNDWNEFFDNNFGSSRPRKGAVDHFFPSDGYSQLPSGFLPGILDRIKESFGIPDPLRIQAGHRDITLQNYQLAASCADRLILGDAVDNIVDELESLVTRPALRFVSIHGINGVQIQQRIDIAPDVCLVPATEVPADAAREYFLNINRWGEPSFAGARRAQFQLGPTTALLISEPAVDCQIVDASSTDLSGLGKESLRQYEIINDVVSALAVSGKCSPFRGWSYTTQIHPALAYNGTGGMGGSGAISLPALRRGEINAEVFVENYSRITKLDNKAKSLLRLGIDRLSRSRSQPNPVDRALDLGICLEILLLDAKANGELSYRLALRGAWLLASDAAARNAIQKVLKSAYDARSRAAHTGSVKEESHSILNQAEEMAADVARKILTEGRFPNWDALVLGGDGFAKNDPEKPEKA